MDNWYGYMDWPLSKDWICETCGERAGLTWGLRHSECRCDNCHTVYTMRNWDEDGEPIVNVPINRLKNEYKAPAKAGWEAWHKPLSTWSDAMWEEAIVIALAEEAK